MSTNQRITSVNETQNTRFTGIEIDLRKITAAVYKEVEVDTTF
jgi:hypothetical protein